MATSSVLNEETILLSDIGNASTDFVSPPSAPSAKPTLRFYIEEDELDVEDVPVAVEEPAVTAEDPAVTATAVLDTTPISLPLNVSSLPLLLVDCKPGTTVVPEVGQPAADPSSPLLGVSVDEEDGTGNADDLHVQQKRLVARLFSHMRSWRVALTVVLLALSGIPAIVGHAVTRPLRICGSNLQTWSIFLCCCIISYWLALVLAILLLFFSRKIFLHTQFGRHAVYLLAGLQWQVHRTLMTVLWMAFFFIVFLIQPVAAQDHVPGLEPLKWLERILISLVLITSTFLLKSFLARLVGMRHIRDAYFNRMQDSLFSQHILVTIVTRGRRKSRVAPLIVQHWWKPLWRAKKTTSSTELQRQQSGSVGSNLADMGDASAVSTITASGAGRRDGISPASAAALAAAAAESFLSPSKPLESLQGAPATVSMAVERTFMSPSQFEAMLILIKAGFAEGYDWLGNEYVKTSRDFSQTETQNRETEKTLTDEALVQLGNLIYSQLVRNQMATYRAQATTYELPSGMKSSASTSSAVLLDSDAETSQADMGRKKKRRGMKSSNEKQTEDTPPSISSPTPSDFAFSLPSQPPPPTTVTYDSVRRFFSKSEASRVFDRLSPGKGLPATRKDIITAVQAMHTERKNLVKSLSAFSSILDTLDALFSGVLCGILLFVILAVFEVNVTSVWASLAAIIVGFAFVFGSTLQSVFQSFLFIFVDRLLDIGDRVQLDHDNENMYVRHFSLRRTTFVKWDGTVIYIPNDELVRRAIRNIRRSPPMTDELTLPIASDTPNAKIEEVIRRVREWGAESTTLNSCSCFIGELNPVQKSLSLLVFIDYYSNFQDRGILLGYRNQVFLFLGDLLAELDIVYFPPTFTIQNVDGAQKGESQLSSSSIRSSTV